MSGDARPVILGLDPRIANDVMTAPGEAVDREAPKREQARAEAAERFRKGRL